MTPVRLPAVQRPNAGNALDEIVPPLDLGARTSTVTTKQGKDPSDILKESMPLDPTAPKPPPCIADLFDFRETFAFPQGVGFTGDWEKKVQRWGKMYKLKRTIQQELLDAKNYEQAKIPFDHFHFRTGKESQFTFVRFLGRRSSKDSVDFAFYIYNAYFKVKKGSKKDKNGDAIDAEQVITQQDKADVNAFFRARALHYIRQKVRVPQKTGNADFLGT